MLQQLLDNLNSRDPSLREDAERRLRALSPDDLMQFVQMEQTQFQRWADKEMFKFSVRAVCLALVTGTAVGLLALLLNRLFKLHLALAIGPVSMFVMGTMFARYRFKPPYSRDVLVSLISESEDVRLVPLLLAMGNEPRHERATKNAVDRALLQLLPKLRAGQADNWTLADRRKFLWHLNFTPSYFERNMATLKALEQIGGEWAVHAVTKCATTEARINRMTKPFNMTYEAATEKVRLLRQAAQECLPFLEQRQQEAERAQTLLRASALTTAPDMLLRPAAPGVELTDGEQLLRSSSDN